MDRLNQVEKMPLNNEHKLLQARKKSRFLGFSLIELMVTVSIVGVISAIAYPSYLEYVTSSNRTEGQSELLRLANLQEQYYVDFRTYINYLTPLGETSATILTGHGHYKIKVTDADASGFEISAIAQGVQATNDGDCTPLTINHAGEKGPEGCWD